MEHHGTPSGIETLPDRQDGMQQSASNMKEVEGILPVTLHNHSVYTFLDEWRLSGLPEVGHGAGFLQHN